MEPCPHCGDLVSDVLSHHLTCHPDNAVPADVVREVVIKDKNRCFVCYIPVDDRLSHYKDVHLQAVQLAFEDINEQPIWRGEDGRFACPWCPQRAWDPGEFLVSMLWVQYEQLATDWSCRSTTSFAAKAAPGSFSHTRILWRVEPNCADLKPLACRSAR